MPDAWIIYVETCAPYDCAAYKVGPDVIEYGQREAVRIATEYRAACKAETWPGVQYPA